MPIDEYRRLRHHHIVALRNERLFARIQREMRHVQSNEHRIAQHRHALAALRRREYFGG